jgi:hypothetical protein
MRLIQLTDNVNGEPIGLYNYTPDTLGSKKELTDDEVEVIMVRFNELNNEGEFDKANELIKANGIERVYIEQEVIVD